MFFEYSQTAKNATKRGTFQFSK